MPLGALMSRGSVQGYPDILTRKYADEAGSSTNSSFCSGLVHTGLVTWGVRENRATGAIAGAWSGRGDVHDAPPSSHTLQ